MPEIVLPKPAEMKTLTLPSGKVVTYREAKGRDLMRAQSITSKSKAELAIPFALIACVASVDGSPIVYEDILEMPLSEVTKLMEVLGENFQSPPQPDSLPSSTSDSPQAS